MTPGGLSLSGLLRVAFAAITGAAGHWRRVRQNRLLARSDPSGRQWPRQQRLHGTWPPPGTSEPADLQIDSILDKIRVAGYESSSIAVLTLPQAERIDQMQRRSIPEVTESTRCGSAKLVGAGLRHGRNVSTERGEEPKNRERPQAQ